jgi:hypothetical protein
MAEDLLKLAEFFDQNSGWFLDFLVIVVAIGLLATLVIHIYRYATGKNDWLGRPIDGEEGEQAGKVALLQLDVCRKENENLEKKLALAEAEKQELLQLLKEKEQEADKLSDAVGKAEQEIQTLQSLYEELDSKYADETYTMSQIMYAADEVSIAIADMDYFALNRDDFYMNLMDYMINTIKDFRKKSPRVAIHVPHPERDDVLIHYAHSAGHSHQIKQYQPPVNGSSAGKAWRTGKPYYVPDVEDPQFEYDRKKLSRKHYRSILCVPIMAGDRFSTRIGVLSVTGTQIDSFDKIEIERIMLFTGLLYPLMFIDLNRKEGK